MRIHISYVCKFVCVIRIYVYDGWHRLLPHSTLSVTLSLSRARARARHRSLSFQFSHTHTHTHINTV